MSFYRRWVYVFGLLAIALGIAIVVETAAQGGGVIGFVIGPLFIGLGIGRIYLLRNR